MRQPKGTLLAGLEKAAETRMRMRMRLEQQRGGRLAGRVQEKRTRERAREVRQKDSPQREEMWMRFVNAKMKVLGEGREQAAKIQCDNKVKRMCTARLALLRRFELSSSL